jgi:microcystin-dependent protein
VAQPYVGEIRMFGGNFPPNGWAFCNGATMAISENETLFQLIGTTYGGDGESTFNLPDLQGRVPIHQGTGPDGQTYIVGEKAGVETVTLTLQQIPNHNHAFIGTGNPGTTTNPPNNIVAQNSGNTIYIEDQAFVPLAPQSLLPEGGSQPHENIQPFLCVAFIISLFGIFPSQS